jgi:hydroxyacylglutathione hydrolase
MAGHSVISVNTGRNDGRSYILVCNETNEAVVIDTDINFGEILRILEDRGAVLKYILLSHCHFDHVSSSDELRARTGAKSAIHRLDIPGLFDPAVNMSGPFRQPAITGRQIDIELEEGDIIAIGKVNVQVLHTPGHTPGSCSFLAGNDLFTGDTVFRGSYGNTGFPGGDMGTLMLSAARLLSLDEGIAIWPGHGMPSTVGRERATNPIRI